MAGMRIATLRRRSDGLPGISGVARLDRRTGRLAGRLNPGDIAIIDHVDLDRVAAETLVAAKPAAVVNAQPSISGRYPNLGPEVIVANGIPLLDNVGSEIFAAVKEGTKIRVDGDLVFVGEMPVAKGTAQDAHTVAALMVEAKSGLSAQLEATYARFVSDRAALVAVHTGWRGLLDAMDTEIRTASDALAARDAAIAQRQAQHTADAASVDYYRRAYRTKAAQVAAMPASQRQRLQLSWVWWDGTELPMAPAGQTLAAAAALLARDDAALQAQAPAIDADLAAATQEHARVEGRVADLDALRAQLDPTTALDPATPAS